MPIRKYRIEYRIITPVDTEWEEKEHAEDVLNAAFFEIKHRFHALIPALNALKPTPVKESAHNPHYVTTDGVHLFYNPRIIISCIDKQDKERLQLEIVHILYHGLLGHFETGTHFFNRYLSWNVMDLEVDRLMRDTGFYSSQTDISEKESLDELEKECPFFGLSLYYEALKNKMLRRKIRELRWIGFCFGHDDHSSWAFPKRKPHRTGLGANYPETCEKKGDSKKIETNWKKARDLILEQGKKRDMNNNTEYSSASVSKSLLCQFQNEKNELSYGTETGKNSVSANVLPDGLKSYRSLLEEFVHINESAKEEDYPDPILYSYGLSLYGDVPIIEPMDVIERFHFHTIILAVDTSGSCEGYTDLFLTQTCGLLKDIADIADIDELRYLECDTEIQQEKTFHTPEELRDLEASHCYYGFGGTDFRPVFDRADALRKTGNTVDAMIYFSDGFGDFPDMPAEYPVYFVIPQQEYSEGLKDFVPDWVNMVVLENNKLRKR
ncbi:MAG: VWA-like domain-containing protein [Lachnospiraceae bacterium]|nr:VWA-like domain-containing protein [Lachnospiraceae bacterium]